MRPFALLLDHGFGFVRHKIKVTRPLPQGNDFVAYIDAIGSLDGTRCLLEWKDRFEPW